MVRHWHPNPSKNGVLPAESCHSVDQSTDAARLVGRQEQPPINPKQHRKRKRPSTWRRLVCHRSKNVEDYSKLPGGGDYEYTADGTYYVGPTCGRWRLNDDKSFTRLPDES